MWSLEIETALPYFLQWNFSVFLFLDLGRPWKWTFKCIWAWPQHFPVNPTWPSDLFLSNNLQKSSLNYLGEAKNFCSVATCDFKKLNPCWIPWLSFPNFPASWFSSRGNWEWVGKLMCVCVKRAKEDLLQPLPLFGTGIPDSKGQQLLATTASVWSASQQSLSQPR